MTFLGLSSESQIHHAAVFVFPFPDSRLQAHGWWYGGAHETRAGYFGDGAVSACDGGGSAYEFAKGVEDGQSTGQTCVRLRL